MELGEIIQTQVTTPLVPTSVAITGSNVPLPAASELSNVSSAGSVSDREPETPEKSNYPIAVKSLDQKPIRKRRRNDGYPPKSDRKITECFKVFFIDSFKFIVGRSVTDCKLFYRGLYFLVTFSFSECQPFIYKSYCYDIL